MGQVVSHSKGCKMSNNNQIALFFIVVKGTYSFADDSFSYTLLYG
jgi:hypothetical protein